MTYTLFASAKDTELLRIHAKSMGWSIDEQIERIISDALHERGTERPAVERQQGDVAYTFAIGEKLEMLKTVCPRGSTVNDVIRGLIRRETDRYRQRRDG